MAALRWHNIDWHKKQVPIHEAVVKGLRKQTKTNKARLVSLNCRALDTLQRQKEQTPRSHIGSLGDGILSPAAPVDAQTVFANPTHGDSCADERRFHNPICVPKGKARGIRYRPPNPMRPHPCDDAAHGSSLAGLCGQSDGAFFGDVFERLFQVAGRRSGNIEQAKLKSLIGQNSPGTPQKNKDRDKSLF